MNSTDIMKRSRSEMVLHELFASEDEKKNQHTVEIPFESDEDFFADDGIFFPFKTSETPLSSCSSFADNQFLRGNLTANVSTPMESVYCLSGNSPSCGTQPTGCHSRPAGGSSRSDEDEHEAGSCEQSTDHLDIKRYRRKVSNRDSARRSRKRKQAHLTDLNREVEKLNGEHDTLSVQLVDAAQRLKDAATNNRVLKSDVEALRAKVKLAEDTVARCTLTSSLSHLLQNYTPQTFMNGNMSRMDNESPTIMYDNTRYLGLTSAMGCESVDTFNGNVSNVGMSDVVSSMSEIWPWESNVVTVTK